MSLSVFFLVSEAPTDFRRTLGLRREADWGGFGWREILFDRFLNHNQMEKKQNLSLGNPKGVISL